MAEVAGVVQSQMSKMLRGEAEITLSQLKAICDLLSLTPSAVMAEAEG